jgi:hypothetical protein
VLFGLFLHVTLDPDPIISLWPINNCDLFYICQSMAYCTVPTTFYDIIRGHLKHVHGRSVPLLRYNFDRDLDGIFEGFF